MFDLVKQNWSNLSIHQKRSMKSHAFLGLLIALPAAGTLLIAHGSVLGFIGITSLFASYVFADIVKKGAVSQKLYNDVVKKHIEVGFNSLEAPAINHYKIDHTILGLGRDLISTESQGSGSPYVVTLDHNLAPIGVGMALGFDNTKNAEEKTNIVSQITQEFKNKFPHLYIGDKTVSYMHFVNLLKATLQDIKNLFSGTFSWVRSLRIPSLSTITQFPKEMYYGAFKTQTTINKNEKQIIYWNTSYSVSGGIAELVGIKNPIKTTLAEFQQSVNEQLNALCPVSENVTPEKHTKRIGVFSQYVTKQAGTSAFSLAWNPADKAILDTVAWDKEHVEDKIEKYQNKGYFKIQS